MALGNRTIKGEGEADFRKSFFFQIRLVTTDTHIEKKIIKKKQIY